MIWLAGEHDMYENYKLEHNRKLRFFFFELRPNSKLNYRKYQVPVRVENRKKQTSPPPQKKSGRFLFVGLLYHNTKSIRTNRLLPFFFWYTQTFNRDLFSSINEEDTRTGLAMRIIHQAPFFWINKRFARYTKRKKINVGCSRNHYLHKCAVKA